MEVIVLEKNQSFKGKLFEKMKELESNKSFYSCTDCFIKALKSKPDLLMITDEVDRPGVSFLMEKIKQVTPLSKVLIMIDPNNLDPGETGRQLKHLIFKDEIGLSQLKSKLKTLNIK